MPLRRHRTSQFAKGQPSCCLDVVLAPQNFEELLEIFHGDKAFIELDLVGPGGEVASDDCPIDGRDEVFDLGIRDVAVELNLNNLIQRKREAFVVIQEVAIAWQKRLQ